MFILFTEALGEFVYFHFLNVIQAFKFEERIY